MAKGRKKAKGNKNRLQQPWQRDIISSLENKLTEDRIFTSKAPIKSKIERAFNNGCKEIKICIKGSNGEQVPTDFRGLKGEFDRIFNKEDCYMVTRDKNLLLFVKSVDTAMRMLKKKSLLGTAIEKVLLESSFTSEYVIKGLDTSISCKEIERLLLVEGIYVHKIVRFNQKGEDALSSTVLIKELGDVDRDMIKLGSESYEVRKFFEKPKVCSKCLKVGHFQARCTATEAKCRFCNGDHRATTCSRIDLTCFRCGSSRHFALDPRCPVVKEEHDILNLVNKKNMSYETAKREVAKEREALKAKKKSELTLSDSEQLQLKGIANAIEELTEAMNNLATVRSGLVNQSSQTTAEVDNRITSEQIKELLRSLR